MTKASDDSESAEIVPPFSPVAKPPAVLVDARRHLEVATNEFYLALLRFELWQVLAYDKELLGRLGKGYAAGGYVSVRSAIFEALLVTLTRMFDLGARGKQPLSLKNISRDLCRPESRSYIVEAHAAEHRDFPTRLSLVTELGRADRAQFERDAEEYARAAAVRTNGRFDALVRLQRALDQPRIAQALARLQNLRNTEVAHRDLQPAATTVDRPKYRDWS